MTELATGAAPGAPDTPAPAGGERARPLASRAARVTLFEDRAEVVRAARAALQAGAQWVALGGASPFVDDDTVQARVLSERARVLAARVRRIVHHEPREGREAVERLEREALAAREAEGAARQDAARARSEEARLRRLLTDWARCVAEVPRGLREGEARGRWRESYRALERALAAALARASEARARALAAERALAHAEARLAEAQATQPRHEALLEVQLEADGAHVADLEITYRTPCALWRPEHLARLHAHGELGRGEATLEIVTYAVAWQRTGEDWDGVQARFSTARPARAASPPPVTDDLLRSRKKSDDERRSVVVEARDQAVAVAGLERGARAVAEMPGVDDGGEPLAYEPRAPVTLASDGRPFRVEIGRVTLPARVERVALPERAEIAHLRATATLTQGGPLLAGPVRLARGAGMVGRTATAFVGRGEPFELGFGADDAVRVRRRVEEARDTVSIIGTQVLRRTVRVFLSNLAGAPRSVEVTERFPVSEIADVEVVGVRASEGVRLDRRDGFARKTVELPAHGVAEIALAYELRAGPKVRLPF
ncbi:MAG TPA: DUF4139 domain-containing protein [Polyangiaceae bacterium]|nr:DUF4139 domain-containing protein [Polyangiaceae bacterium]